MAWEIVTNSTIDVGKDTREVEAKAIEAGGNVGVAQGAEVIPDSGTSSILTKWEELPQSVVKSTGRTMQILEFFDDHQGPANIAQVSRALGYPQSSTSEIMRSLNVLGYFSYDSRARTFMPTSRVRFLGSWINNQLHGRDRLSRFVQDLNTKFGQTAFLAVRNKLATQYIQVAQATTSLRLHLTPGQRSPLLRTATGLVLLKDLDDAEICKMIRRANAERSEQQELIVPEQVLEQIRFARKNNYIFVERSLVSPGAAVIAMALPRELFAVPTVVGVGGATELVLPRKDSMIKFMTEMILNNVVSSEEAQH